MKRITTNFGFSSTAADVIGGVDLSGKRAVVTGGGISSSEIIDVMDARRGDVEGGPSHP